MNFQAVRNEWIFMFLSNMEHFSFEAEKPYSHNGVWSLWSVRMYPFNPLVTNREVNKPGHSRYMGVCAWIFLKDGFSERVLSQAEEQARTPLFQIVPHACVIIFISWGTITKIMYANNLQSEKPPVQWNLFSKLKSFYLKNVLVRSFHWC